MTKHAFAFTGPQTSGKSTQTIYLAETLRAKLIRGRDILPELSGQYGSHGELIPDSLFLPALQRVLNQEIAPQVVFDNIPRTPAQAKLLVSWATTHGVQLHVVKFELTEDDVATRIMDRQICPKCGESYHPILKPSATEGVCDHDQAVLTQKPGDDVDFVRSSYRRYAEWEAPIIAALARGGVIHPVSAEGIVLETVYRLYSELASTIFKSSEMAEGYFHLRDWLNKQGTDHIFVSGMPVFLYGGRALMKDFDILVPDTAMSGISREFGCEVKPMSSSVASTNFAGVAEEVEVVSELVVTADGQNVPFTFDFLWEEVKWVRFMGLDCPIMGLEDLILFKAALGRSGNDDWNQHKSDLVDVEGLVGAQNVDWQKLKERAERLKMLPRLEEKLTHLSITPGW